MVPIVTLGFRLSNIHTVSVTQLPGAQLDGVVWCSKCRDSGWLPGGTAGGRSLAVPPIRDWQVCSRTLDGLLWNITTVTPAAAALFENFIFLQFGFLSSGPQSAYKHS